MERYLWKFYSDCSREGNLEGLFVATEEDVKKAIGYEVRFGEVLGKHSNIRGCLEETDIEKVELDLEIVKKVTEILGETWSGYNPLNYIRDINYLLDGLNDDQIHQLAIKMELDTLKCNNIDEEIDLISNIAYEFDFEYLEEMVDEIKDLNIK